MSAEDESSDVAPTKDMESEHPVPTSWRTTLKRIVHGFVEGDYALRRNPLDGVIVSERAASQVKEYLEDYGEQLVELDDLTWNTSSAQWQEVRWDVLVDLWTAESGLSDLAMLVHVHEWGSKYRFEVRLVYVP